MILYVMTRYDVFAFADCVMIRDAVNCFVLMMLCPPI